MEDGSTLSTAAHAFAGNWLGLETIAGGLALNLGFVVSVLVASFVLWPRGAGFSLERCARDMLAVTAPLFRLWPYASLTKTVAKNTTRLPSVQS